MTDTEAVAVEMVPQEEPKEPEPAATPTPAEPPAAAPEQHEDTEEEIEAIRQKNIARLRAHLAERRGPRETFYQKYVQDYMTKGPISNMITFCVMLLGIILVSTTGGEGYFRWTKFVLSTGLFGFAGGVTNWIAVKMLFDKVPGLIGSGVIPNRFKEIRAAIKRTVLITFFDPVFLERYITQKAGAFMANINVEDKMRSMLESPIVDSLIDSKLEDLSQRPEGMYLAMMGLQPSAIKPLIKPFILGMGSDVAPLIMSLVSPSKLINIEKLRDQVDGLMTEKLKELTPEIVKEIMEDVMRVHLGWLIVWGNVFGALIGCLSEVVYVIADAAAGKL